MSRCIVIIFVLLLLFSAGCAKQRIHSTPPLRQHTTQKQDSPDVIKPVLKTDPYTVNGHTYNPHLSSKGYKAQGLASWYGDDFHGKTTANGETYNMYAMTAAHRTLPMGSILEVTDQHSGRKVIVRVNDRGPFADPDRRIIDLSYTAAAKLGIVDKGLTPVEIRAIDDINVEPVAAGEVSPATGAPSTEAIVAEAAESETSVEEIIISDEAKAGGVYFVQVGSFTELNRAENVLNDLRSRGYKESRMIAVDVNGMKYMRVQAGKFYTIPTAEEAITVLNPDYGEMFIVTN